MLRMCRGLNMSGWVKTKKKYGCFRNEELGCHSVFMFIIGIEF